ncbi:SOS response-associated peptidase [Fonticella tunisiensis]|uniref:Abasic site processing protein n=1 Tax=Fonticella tunisiensis TaxID=1096341 RepID=A0A4R7KPR0_9CLOT|nr:SOS response-associated peptidase [Fonticella tunisiensis]TDT61130.1 putative SOS response-associated peptidase YedK [Fonticella tunisiensis]
MCGRYLLDNEIRDMLESYNIKRVFIDELLKGDIYPGCKAPVIVDNSGMELRKYTWGFMVNNRKIINARAESLAIKNTFKNSFYRRRCLIPCSAFYEWKNERNRKVKYRISLKNKEMFSLAGIYNMFHDKNLGFYEGFVIITTEANKDMSDIHHRMPLIIDKKWEDVWINNKSKIEDIMKLLSPFNSQLLIEPCFDGSFNNEQLSMF